MEWGMSELMRNPEVMKKLQPAGADQGGVPGEDGGDGGRPAAGQQPWPRVHEAGDQGSPAAAPAGAAAGARESIEECELDGYTIPAKSRVIINAWAIGRDPRYWEAADEFKPERFEDGARDFTGSSYEFLPFGSGRRMCPGFNYGLASMELAFVGLLYHFDWSLPDGVEEVDMGEAPGLGVRRRTPLLLCATPFVPVDA
jgi:cytochrome P450